MSFLDPVAGLIAAGLSVPAVLLLYFLKLRRQPLRVSSTLLWERAVHDVQVNAPFRWLRLSWLLLLQLLIALLISGAIGRPALEGNAPLSGRILIVIDCSASMNALDGAVADARTLARLRGSETASDEPVARLEQAKADALALIDRLRRGGAAPGEGRVQIAIAAWAGQARRLTAFTEDATALREAVLAITPTDQPESLPELVRLIEAAGRVSTDEDATPQRTRIFLFSDGGAFDQERGGIVVNAPVDVTYVRAGADPEGPAASNTGIVAISARRDHDDPTLARIFVRLITTAPQPRQATLQLRAGGRLEQVATVQLPAATEEAPGEAAHTFDLLNTRGGVVTVTLAGGEPAGDLLAADDGAAVVLSAPRRPSVLVVAPGTDGAEADAFLMNALSIMPLQALERVDARGYEALLAAGGIGRFELVIFDRTEAPPPPTASMHIGADPGVPGVTLAPLEAAQEPSGVDGNVGTPWTRVLMWERTHPIMRYVSLDNLVIAPPLSLTLPEADRSEDEGDRTDAARATVLATGATGPLIALLTDRGLDRLVLAFAMERTNWGPEASWLIFLTNAIEVLTMRSEAMMGRAYTTIEPVRLQPAVGAGEITATGPMTLTWPLPAERDRSARLSLGVLPRAGVYEVTGAAEAQHLAVNLTEQRESEIPVRPEIRIGGKAAAGKSIGQAAPREIWHWFVLAAIGLLGIEWLLYAWRMRL